MFYPEGLVDFALEKSFQKWLFGKYCPHFSFITLLQVHIKIETKKN